MYVCVSEMIILVYGILCMIYRPQYCGMNKVVVQPLYIHLLNPLHLTHLTFQYFAMASAIANSAVIIAAPTAQLKSVTKKHTL